MLGRTQHETDQMRAEDPVEKIHACSANSSAKSKRFTLLFPTVTLSSTRLCLSINSYPDHTYESTKPSGLLSSPIHDQTYRIYL